MQVDLDPRITVRALGPAERKFVEIARAMLFNPRFLILDEPTAAMEPAAAKRVLRMMRTLRDRGWAWRSFHTASTRWSRRPTESPCYVTARG